MGLSQRLITDEIFNKATYALQEMNQYCKSAIKLKAIIAAKKHGVNLVADIFDITANTLRSWVKNFSIEDLQGLQQKPGRGRNSKVSDIQQESIARWIKEDPNLTINAVILKLRQQFGLDVSKSAVHRILHKLDLSYITPRPQHHKQNKELHDEFFKKSGNGHNE
jgi:transposase